MSLVGSLFPYLVPSLVDDVELYPSEITINFWEFEKFRSHVPVL